MDKWTQGDCVEDNKENSPSKLWNIYHLWAGFCVKLFADLSGISDLLLDVIDGHDPASASLQATTSVIFMVGLVILGFQGSRLLLQHINKNPGDKRSRIITISILPFAYFAAAIILASIINHSNSASSKTGSINIPGLEPVAKPSNMPGVESVNIAPIQAFDTVQSAEGLSEENLDQEALINIENWIIDTLAKKEQVVIRERGLDPIDIKDNLTANSVFIDIKGRKLGVVKIKMHDAIRMVTIFGIVGEEFHRVTCMRKSDHDIPIWSGPCGSKIEQVFGVSMEP